MFGSGDQFGDPDLQVIEGIHERRELLHGVFFRWFTAA